MLTNEPARADHSRLSRSERDPIARENDAAPVVGIRSLFRSLKADLRSDGWAFPLICMYLIFEYNKLQAVWPILDFLPWTQTLLIAAIVAAFFDRASRPPAPAAIAAMASLAIVALLSSAFAFDPHTAFENWFLWGGWVVIVLTISSIVTTRQRVIIFCFIYFVANLKMAQHGFRAWAGRGFAFADWGVTGSPGWFENSGEFGMQMAMVAPLLIAQLRIVHRRLSRPLKLLTWLFLVAILGSILASSSRGAIFAIVIVGLWAFVSARGKRLRFAFILAAVVTVALLALPEEFKHRFDTMGSDNTSTSRLTYWKAGMEIFKKHPITGIGFQNWTQYVSEHRRDLIVTGHVEVIHNTPLEVATELGSLGFIVFASVVVLIWRTNSRSQRLSNTGQDRLLGATAQGLNGSVIAFLVASFFMSVAVYPYLWITLAMSISVSIAARALPQPEPLSPAKRRA
jgi:putative inorganic carbon (hco3(-)) transporter